MKKVSSFLQIFLLQYGMKIAIDINIKHLLFFAVEQNNIKAMQHFIKVEIDVQVKDSYKCSLYERAKQANKTKIIKYLNQIEK